MAAFVRPPTSNGGACMIHADGVTSRRHLRSARRRPHSPASTLDLNMFGFIHESIRQLIVRKYGEDLWLQILVRAGFENGKENIVNHYYTDTDTYLLVDSVSAMTKLSREQVWEMYGTFLIVYTMELGWDELVRSMSPNLKGFLDSLDSLHYFIDHVVYKANLRGPSFRCEQNTDGTITLHYFTGRPGLYPIVKGVLKEVARCVFNIEISLTITGRTQRSVQTANGGERIEEHVIFHIKTISNTRGEEVAQDAMIGQSVSPVEGECDALQIVPTDFCALLPYHVVFDEDCKLVQVGKELYNHVPKEFLQPGTPIMRIFELTRPQIPFDFDNICNFINAVFVIQIKTAPTDLRKQREDNGNTSDFSTGAHLKLKGQMMKLASGKHIIYLCSPYVTSIQELMDFGMRLTAMPLHDATRDLILLNQQRLSDVEVNLQLEANNEQLEAMAKDLEVEHTRSDIILKDMLPTKIADQLLHGEHIEPCEYEEATVMFSDIPNFTTILPQTNPKDIVQLLNDLFTRFDRIISYHQVYKVETVGDSYMTVCGIPEYIPHHCEYICHAALGMIWESRSVLDPVSKNPLQVRIGIHSGPLVAGVVGSKMPRYSLFGETVTTASKLENHGLPGKIHCSEKAYKCANETGRFEFVSRGRIAIKGKGEMDTYFLVRSNKKSIWEIINRERDVNLNSIDGYDELESGAEMVDLKRETAISSSGAVKNSRACVLQ